MTNRGTTKSGPFGPGDGAPDALAHAALASMVKAAQERRVADVEREARALLVREEDNLAAQYLLGWALARLGRPAEAAPWLAEAALREGAPLDAIVEYSGALFDAGKLEHAVAQIRRALEMAPEEPRVLHFAAGFHHHAERHVEAMELAIRAMKHGEPDPHVMRIYANSLVCLGHTEKAWDWFTRALEIAPEEVEILRERAFCTNHCESLSTRHAASAHGEYGRVLAKRSGGTGAPWSGAVERRGGGGGGGGGRKLRVGFLSPDLREHSVTRFFMPLAEHLERSRFELLAYSANRFDDATTARYRELIPTFRDVQRLTDQELATRIRSDNVDVLIDLAGLTTGTRLGVMTLRAAPVQATYLGYPASTGVPGVDVRFVDEHTDPTPFADAHATERLVRVEGCFLCYRAPAKAPAAVAYPARWQQENAPIVFGSFNNTSKLSVTTLELWADVLRATPGSVLLVKGAAMYEARCKEAVVKRIASTGIDPSRIIAAPWAKTIPEHLAHYERMDVALDSFPYNGTTTTCEALWMGVPVVSLTGSHHAARVGKSLLHAAGLAQLATDSREQFVRVAAGLGQSRGTLAAFRSGLRERLQSSMLCDEAAYARRFGDAIERAWEMVIVQKGRAAA